jgi:hypothetical protein
MAGTVSLKGEQYRQLVALRYLNASESLLEGLKTQQGTNDLHFLVTLRSFIEYTKRGIWFLAWASDQKLASAEKLAFQRSGSPNLARMDEMVNNALGLGKVSHLLTKVQGVNEPFLDCLHALTHGNPISVRMFGIGLQKIFQTDKLAKRAEMELNTFRILVYRRILGEPLDSIWKAIRPINNRPDDIRKMALTAGIALKTSGLAKAFEPVPNPPSVARDIAETGKQ